MVDANINPELRLYIPEDQKPLEGVLSEQMEWRSIKLEKPEPHNFKEEEEEVPIKQEQNDIITVIVNSGEEEEFSQDLQLHENQTEENRKDSVLRPWDEDESEESCLKDSEDDWEYTTEGTAVTMVRHKRKSSHIKINKDYQRLARQAHQPDMNQENKKVCILKEEDEIFAVIVSSDQEEDAPENLQLHHYCRQSDGKEPSRNTSCILRKPGVEDEIGSSSLTVESEDHWEETVEEPRLKTVKVKEFYHMRRNKEQLSCTKLIETCHPMSRHEKIYKREKLFSCSECGKLFTEKYSLKVHERNHTGERPFSCPECGKRFKEKNKMVRHVRSHQEDKQFGCSECGKKFRERGDLRKHERIHTGEKPFLCSDCGKGFTHKANLLSHEKIHTGEKPFGCPECCKRFRRRTELVIHIRIHTGEEPFVCPVCGKKFRRKNDMVKHGRIHTGEKPFSCLVCDKRFTSKSSLNVHVKTFMHRKKHVLL